MKYWKANAELSAKIISLLKERVNVYKAGKRIAKRLGADPKQVYYDEWIFSTRIAGFVFPGNVAPDKSWVRLQKTTDGWRPRSRTAIDYELKSFTSNAFHDIRELLGGGSIYRPGVVVVNAITYLTLPDEVKPKDCVRLSDIEYESATKPKRKVKAS